VQILKQLGKQRALEIAKTAGADWQNWTLDPQVLALIQQRQNVQIKTRAYHKQPSWVPKKG
jgi:hypothetical protein